VAQGVGPEFKLQYHKKKNISVKSSIATFLKRSESNLETWGLKKESKDLFFDLGKAACMPKHIP
jgi:hypothetical protein